ncbi:DUF927 domain-containing protein [Desulfovibrio sp. ZJ369]|uniref:TOPRIM and DUF927 domain-containing protein n=1 Tax=Desulfovibrio sp. ZJ369 TaxID=2709793 RepID=UPI0013ECD824|nr:DUF927 domain-containing protein [Desulfovibrio sp. ZJ369]
MPSHSELLERAAAALTAAGLTNFEPLDASGALAMCGTSKKPNGQAGRYKLHMDNFPRLWCVNYHEGGEGQTVNLYEPHEIELLSPAEKAALRERVAKEKAAALEAREKAQKAAAQRAGQILEALAQAGTDNAYLTRKEVPPMRGLRQDEDGRLVVPVWDCAGKLASLQYIGADGGKRFLKGPLPRVYYFSIPAKDGSKADPLPEKLPSGFSLRTGGKLPGLWHTEVKGDDSDPVETWVCGPLTVQGATRDENGVAWGLLLHWQDADGGAHSWAMPKALLAGKDSSAVLARLADEGLPFSSGQRAKNLLGRFLTEYQTRRRIRCVPRTGWHGGAFVLPDEVLYAQNPLGQVGRVGQAAPGKDLPPSQSENKSGTSGTDEKLVLQTRTPGNPFRTAGTLDGWRDTVGAWTAGNSRLLLAVCAAFAAPLLEMCGMESGGFNFSGQSSSGKTTALVAAASVWGRGASSGGFVQNWRATSNGLEGMAALYSDSLLCLDEIGQAPGRTVQEAAYMLGNGMGKSRASQDGSARAVKSWRCFILSTGEIGLAEKIREEGGRARAGQEVRLVDIPADAGAGMGIFEELHDHASPQAFADVLKQSAATHYGHAVRAFIRALQAEREKAGAELARFMERGVEDFCPADADGQVRRVARRFLLCAGAGEMAAEWGLVPWEQGAAVAAARTCFEAWLSQRGGAGAAEDRAILEAVRLFLEQHGQSRFQDVDKPDAVCINRVGFRQADETGTTFYVLSESFRAEVCKGHNHRRAATVLLESGLLLPGDGGNIKRRPPIPSPAPALQCFACSCWQRVPGLAWWCGRCVVTGREINMQSRCDRGFEECQASSAGENRAATGGMPCESLLTHGSNAHSPLPGPVTRAWRWWRAP